MGQALYRKYRPKRLSEVIGQEHITQTLEQSLKTGHISHAYLFTGPRGVGKTTIARILAHEINGIPYTDDTTDMDIIEIDAASNRRIDEIRELRDKIYVAPTNAPYKVYIIDEVHMLTREAFNALLKTLEEPPAHVVFILATTDAHKLPDTIISRTQRYTFRPVDRSKVIQHLEAIAHEEKVTITNDALAMLADHGEGSFRDSIGLLDQAGSRGVPIQLSDVQNLLGIPPLEAIAALRTSLAQNDTPQDIAKQLAVLQEQGFQATAIAKQLAALIRSDIIDTPAKFNPERGLALLTKLIEVPVAHDPDRYLEIALIASTHIAFKEPPIPATAPIASGVVAEPVVSQTAEKAIASVPTPKESVNEPIPKKPIVAKNEPKPKSTAQAAVKELADNRFTETLWPEILNALKSKYNTLYGIVRMAHPTFNIDEQTLELTFAFAFHQKRINDAKNQTIIADIIEQLTGKKVKITCTLDKALAAQPVIPAPPTPTVPKPEVPVNPEALSAISTIFGGGEMLEP
jgi:DNA polymerase-3 subunit gamma/tau